MLDRRGGQLQPDVHALEGRAEADFLLGPEDIGIEGARLEVQVGDVIQAGGQQDVLDVLLDQPGLAFDLAQVLLARALIVQVLDQVEAGGDDRQGRLEVVGDGLQEVAQGGQLAALDRQFQALLLGPLAIGDILVDSQEVGGLAAGIAKRFGPAQQPDVSPVRRLKPELFRVGAFFRDQVKQHVPDALQVVGVHAVCMPRVES